MLNISASWFNAEYLRQVVRHKVADTDALGLAGLVQVLQRPPGVLPRLCRVLGRPRRHSRPVDQHQIDVVHAQRFERPGHHLQRRVVAQQGLWNFGGDKQLGPRHPARRDRRPGLGIGLVQRPAVVRARVDRPAAPRDPLHVVLPDHRRRALPEVRAAPSPRIGMFPPPPARATVGQAAGAMRDSPEVQADRIWSWLQPSR